MSQIHDIIKENRLVYNFTRESMSDKLSHAYLVVADDLSTTNEVLNVLTSIIFCDNKCACGNCINCIRLEHGNHPNLHIYGKDSDIKTATVEQIIDTMNRTPLLDGLSVYVINNADKMNEVAQNKLLKTIEEPLDDIVILLGAINDNALLATIKSRVKKLYINIWNSLNITKLLSTTYPDISEDKIRFASDMSIGSLERAEELLNDELAFAKFTELNNMLLNMNSSHQVMSYLGILGKDTNAATLSLSMLERIFNKALHDHVNGQKSALTALYSANSIVNINDLITMQYKKLKANCQVSSIEDSLLLGLLELRYKLG